MERRAVRPPTGAAPVRARMDALPRRLAPHASRQSFPALTGGAPVGGLTARRSILNRRPS
jgi:hypothetical protein